MLNMFGRGYEELGSSDKGLILRNSGKVKILWGKKFIDLLDSDGNLNVKLQAIIKPIKSLDDIKLDGFYFYDLNLIAKVGEEILVLTSNEGDTYVSFIEKLDVSSESKYIALQNIGFIYPSISDSNVYPTSGIIYVEESKSLFIIDNGLLTKYLASIPNPYTQQFVIAKDGDDNTRGALVIQGSGATNGLQFDNLIIYSKDIYSILEASKEFDFLIGNKRVATISLSGIETESIYSSGASSNSGYRIYKNNNKWILDIDLINVRDGFDINIPDKYYKNEITSLLFVMTLFLPKIISDNGIDIIDYILFDTSVSTRIILGHVNNSGNDSYPIFEIPLRVIPCSFYTSNNIDYVTLSSSSTHVEIKDGQETNVYRPSLSIYRFNFIYENPNKITFINKNNQIRLNSNGSYVRILKLPFGSSNGEEREILEIHDETVSVYNSSEYYAFEEKTVAEAFNLRTMFLKYEVSVDPRFIIDLENDEYTFVSTDDRQIAEPYSLKLHFKIGDINELRETPYPYNNNNIEGSRELGIYSKFGIFSGAEFREPLPLREVDPDYNGPEVLYKDEPVTPTYNNCPKYSTTLQKALVKSQANTNNIIYDSTNSILEHENLIVPKKWIPLIANYIEDLTNSYTFDPNNGYTITTNDKYLYDGKLFLFKINTNNDSTITNGMTGRFLLVSIETNLYGQPVDRYSSWLWFYYEGTTVPFESEFCNGATLLVLLRLTGNYPGLYILFEAYPPGIKNFYDKVFNDTDCIDDRVGDLDTRVRDIEDEIWNNNDNLIDRVGDLDTRVRDIEDEIWNNNDNLIDRIITLESALNIQNSSS